MFPLSLEIILGSKLWCSGESTRLPSIWPGFKSRYRRHMWVEFVVGSLPCSERFFSGCSCFSPTFPDSNSTRNQVDEEPALWMCTSKSLFTYLYLAFDRDSLLVEYLTAVQWFSVNAQLFTSICP